VSDPFDSLLSKGWESTNTATVESTEATAENLYALDESTGNENPNAVQPQ
jgi:hypothetical protein